MAKVAFSLNLLPLIVLLSNLVSGESDAGVGLEIPPHNPNPRRHQQADRNWEAWTSPEGQLWYPGRVDYRSRQRQTGDGAGATPAGSDGHDTSTRRYFSLEEGPQFLSEHKLITSAHSQYGQGGVEGGVGGGRGSEQGWYPYEGQYGTAEGSHLPGEGNGQYPVNERGQYGTAEESHSPGESNVQYPVDERGQYGSYSNRRYAGNVPYGQYFLNGERVPDRVDPLAPKPNVDYIPDHMRGLYIPGQAGQGAHYAPEGNGQFIPRPDSRYVPENVDPRRIGPDGYYIHPDYAAVPDPNGGQNGYYVNGRDDFYPDSQYPYYYGEGEDYGQVGVDGGEYDEYIPPGQPHDQNTFYERGQQPGGGIDSRVPAGQYEKQSPDQDTGHPVHRPNLDSNHMIFAGRDFLPVPTTQDNHTPGQRGVPDSLSRHHTEERQEVPNLVQTDSSRHAQNQSISESEGVRRGHYSQSERDYGLDRRIPHTTTAARPAKTHSETTHETTTTTNAPPTTTTTTAPPTTSTKTTTTTPVTTTRHTPTTTIPTPTTTTTIRSTIVPLAYNPRHGRPSRYPTREHQRGRGTNSHIDSISGERWFDEVPYPQRATIPTVEIDLSKLMPEEEIHGPEDSGSIVNSFRHPLRPRATLSPSGSVEDERRRHSQGERGEAHSTDTQNQRGHYAGGRQPYQRPYQRPDQQSRHPHSSKTGSTGSGVGSYSREPPRRDIIRPRQPSIVHGADDQTDRQHNRDGDQSLPYWPETPRYGHRTSTNQRSGDRHRANPERPGYGSYQPTDENESYNYAAGRDRTHSQGQPRVDARYGLPDDTETKRQIFDPSLDKSDSSSEEGLPGVSHRGTCPSVSQCRCCRWSTQQSRKTMECLQPKYKTVEVQVCTEENNGVCVRTGKRKTLKPNGAEVKMCSKVQLKRSCFVCCPTFYPRGHNQTCNGVLDGIDKTGLRISVEADIGGFYQPPRVSKSATPYEVAQDEPYQQGRLASEMNGQAAYRALASIMADSEKRMVADQAANGQRMCIVHKMGPSGQTRAERRPCPSKVEPPQYVTEENTTGACCLTREQLGNLFLRYCCNTKRYNGRVYSQRQCCGTKETSPKHDREREPLQDRNAGFDVRRPEEESTPSRVRMDSLSGMDSESRILLGTKASQIEEDSEETNFEAPWPSESESQRTRRQFRNANARPSIQSERDDTLPNPEYPRRRMGSPVGSDTETRREESAEESIDANGNTQTSVDTARQRKCCPPGTRLRSRSNGELPDSNSQKSSRRTSGLWMRVYSCCANGNYLQKVACCLRRSPVSPLCCTKVSSMRS